MSNDGLIAELEEAAGLLQQLQAVVAFHPAVADYLPYGTRERMIEWMKRRPEKVIAKARAEQQQVGPSDALCGESK